ncbi:HNH endonuclease [Hyalangium rubrum]|uniref:HNH endonuclease n=1 Tax=Hyalangium rubrum TaxID=3103134 RepID=A0ABU5H6X2_9BACT|nr:HNH endonuclease [Hyalangium sp. s54d21]MDY7228507.1 HNH endonuclease [Hyalangium sp. s54d21]
MRWKFLLGLAATMAWTIAGCAGPEPSLRGGRSRAWPDTVLLGALPSQEGPPSCGGQPVPRGWPELSSGEDVLSPFLACTSPAEFIELQRGVDMARLVDGLDDWSAVRLGTLGPLRAGAENLNRKRAAFLVTATREYGASRAQVFALFLLHSAFTDDIQQVLRLLAQDKHLEQTLGPMGAVRETLRQRGLSLASPEDRAERPSDVVRGMVSAATEALSTSELRRGALTLKYTEQRGQLPLPYQQVLDEIERAELEAAFSPHGVALGSFDALTFGVPLGFYNLVAGTCHGVYSLTQGQYEQASRELSAAVVLVALYAGGKAVRFVSEGQGSPRWVRVQRLTVPELGFKGLAEVADRLWERLGGEGMRQLARYMQAQREAALFVYERDKAAGLRETPKGMTWHHHQDRTTLQLVPTDIHARTGHTGGFAGGQ